MSRLACVLSIFLLALAPAQARHHHVAPPPPVVLNVGGLQFQIPANWQAQTLATAARAGQWSVPPPDSAQPAGAPPPGGVEVVVFFFGPNVGGTAQENIDGWAASVTNADGHPASPTPKKRTVAGHLVTEVLFGGTYAKPSLQAGLPPTPMPDYALFGAIIENPAGTIYWRATGPAGQVAALAPVFDQVVDSLKPTPPDAATPRSP